MNSDTPKQNQPSDPQQIPEVTVSFDTFDSETLLPETTMAFDTGFDTGAPDLPDPTQYPAVVSYARREEVGRGGMAKIFSADDPLLARLVAIKVSTADTSVPDTLFLREAEVLANLAHPNIPPIHSRGTDDLGRAFYSMKLIHGKTLQKILKQLASGDPETTGTFTLQRLLEIFRKVCDGVAFAHAKGYLHRDLKPENIMVGEFGEVLVMDWGLAVAFREHAQYDHPPGPPPEGEESGTIRLQGTPQYMSPEQVEGLVEGLDERSDVYALGGVLYAILTTNSPFSGTSLNEVLDRVRNGQITPMPEVRVITGPSGKTEVQMPEALRAVTFKAMALRRSDRYSSVNALVADIEAYQNGFATSAEQAGLLRQLTLLIKRNRLASSLAAMLLVVAAAFTVRLAQSEKLSRLRAIEAQNNAAEATAEKKAARHSAADAQMAVAEIAEREGNSTELRRSLQSIPEECRDQKWSYLDDRLNGETLHLVSKTDSPWLGAEVIPKKPALLLTLEKDGAVRCVDLNTGAIQDLFTVNPAGLTSLMGVSADGSLILVGRTISKPKSPQQTVFEAYSVADKKLKFTGSIPHSADYFIFNTSGNLFGRCSYAGGGGVTAYNPANGAVLWEKNSFGWFTASFSEDGEVINLYSSSKGFLQLDPRTGQDRIQPSPIVYPNPIPGCARIVSISPSGADTFVPSKAGFDVLETKTGKLKFTIQQPPGRIALKRVEADWTNQLLFCVYRKGNRDAVLQVHNSQDGKKLISRGFSTPNTLGDLRILTHPQSKHVVVLTSKYLKAWNIQPARSLKQLELAPRPPTGITHSFCFVENADTGLAYLSKNVGGVPTLLDLKERGTQETPQTSFGPINGNYNATLISSSDGKTVALANNTPRTAKGTPREVQICKMENGAFSPVSRRDMGVWETRVQMSPSGKLLWQGMYFVDTKTLSILPKVDRTGFTAVEEPASTRWVGEDRVVEIAVPQVGQSEEDEETLSRVLLLWSTGGGKPLATASAPYAVAVAASPDASQILEAGSDLRMRLRNAKTLEIIREIRVHDAPLTAVAWHPHLPFAATASEDHSVKIWDLRTDKMVQKYSLFLDMPNGLYWSPDGKGLAVQHTEASTFIDIFRPESCQ